MSLCISFPPPPFCPKEALRYAGVKEADGEMEALLMAAYKEAEGALSYRACCRRFPIRIAGDDCDLGFAKLQSKSLARRLAVCDEMLLLGATLGLGMDRLIFKYSRLSPSRALMLQAIGTERIEALCDAFGEKAAKETGLYLTPRFSPGYGDVPLALQKDIFAALEIEKSMGLTLNESLIMSPTKSVTALIGLSKTPLPAAPHPCARCEMKNCAMRRST